MGARGRGAPGRPWLLPAGRRGVRGGRRHVCLATSRREHVRLAKGQLLFEYTAKSTRHREQAIAEAQVCKVVRSLKWRRGGGDQLLMFRSGPRWHQVTAAGINDYIRELSGGG